MAFTEDEYKKIDDYIQRNKQIQSQSEWVVINNERRIESVIQLTDGNIIEVEFSFRGSVNKNAPTLDDTWGELKLLYSNKNKETLWVSRISYNPVKNHTNCKLENFEWSLRQLKKGVCRLYKWENRKEALKNGMTEENAPATPLPEIKTFDAFIKTFKDYLHITGEIRLPVLSPELKLEGEHK